MSVKMREAIKVENLNFAYDEDKKVLEDISFTVHRGELIGIAGDSGCGKSTLCHILCGIIPHIIGGTISGSVIVNGLNLKDAELKDLANSIGFVMQNPDRQIVTSTVEDELAFGPENYCIPPEEIKRRVDDVIDFLELEKIRLDNPNKLSGGQKQLVAIGSVLTMEPEILVMDEPFSHLDMGNRLKLRKVIDDLVKRGKTVIVIEHDLKAVDMADRWIVIEDGRIQNYELEC